MNINYFIHNALVFPSHSVSVIRYPLTSNKTQQSSVSPSDGFLSSNENTPFLPGFTMYPPFVQYIFLSAKFLKFRFNPIHTNGAESKKKTVSEAKTLHGHNEKL